MYMYSKKKFLYFCKIFFVLIKGEDQKIENWLLETPSLRAFGTPTEMLSPHLTSYV